MQEAIDRRFELRACIIQVAITTQGTSKSRGDHRCSDLLNIRTGKAIWNACSSNCFVLEMSFVLLNLIPMKKKNFDIEAYKISRLSC